MTEEKRGIIPPVLMDQSIDDQYTRIQDILNGLKRYAILNSAVQSGLFDILADGPQPERKIFSELGYRSASVESWIAVLKEMGMLEQSEDGIRIPSGLSPYLVSDSPLYQGDAILSVFSSRWTDIGAFLQEEQISPPKGGMNPAFLKVVAQHSMHGEVQEVTRRLLSYPEFCNAKHMLDIGGGHALYSISFCQQNSHLSAVILDRPQVTPFTREMVEKYGLGSRIGVIDGDMNLALPGSGYDLIFISHILYRYGDIPGIIKRISGALKEGGVLISNHKFADNWDDEGQSSLARFDTALIRDIHRMISEEVLLDICRENALSWVSTDTVPSITGSSTLHRVRKMN